VKGLGYFLKAARALLKALPEARPLIIGDGPLRSDLERRAWGLGIAHAVQFSGFRTDVFNVLNALDVFVMPSIHEGLPMALLGASALGKPIVASAVGRIPEHAPVLGKPVLAMRNTTERPEAVEAGNARLVGISTETIASAVQQLLDDVEVYEKMSRARNPLGDGHASEQIFWHILEMLGDEKSSP